ncbi:AMP-binding protein [Paracraurococcus lichenis]|uniref:Long-chain-fatty-acid--CoA ligase n=1 Tax=Paracraurococcus lichenis TaxID=3064888 RepID=A0ABT9DSH7_9PROT|nr:AMP-binding protein [Paracraurococcus sp. LOR1-02]MDO9706854.1 AMP-binding protein [Paracraurococcus sp. LOR1-02]
MRPGRPFPWEAVYPPGLDWGLAIGTGTLGGLLERSAAEFGPRIAIRYRDTAIAYADLLAMARRVAGALLALPAARDGVALLLGNTAFHPCLVFGAALAGIRVTQLSPIDAPRTITHKLRDSGARVLVTLAHEGLLTLAGALRAQGLAEVLVVGDDAHWGAGPPSAPVPEGALRIEDWLRAPEPAALPAVRPQDVMLLQYTGGTTGLPKGAMLTHANLTAACAQYDAWNGGRGPDAARRHRKVIGVLPLFHIYAFTVDLLMALTRGDEMLLHARFDAEAVLHDIEVEKATDMCGVPTMWIALANHPRIDEADLSSLQGVASGGAALPPEVAQRFERITGKRISGGWGMTETAPAGTSQPNWDGAGPRSGTIGVPLPGIEMRVVSLDDPTRVLPPGETGEIAIRGPNVFQGYWNRPEETASAFLDGFFLTGDIGRMEPDGYFVLTDRKKDMILSGGFNVYPRLIEDAIHEHPDVLECAVIGIADEYRGQAAKAFVTLKPGAVPFTLEGLRVFLADRLGKHEMPAALEIRDALPRTPVGKLAKLELIEEERRRGAATIGVTPIGNVG